MTATMSDASSSSDDPRRDDDESSRDAQDTDAILARRRRFVAAALGSLALATSAGCSPPQPCLEVVEPDRPSSDASEASAPRDVSAGDAQDDGGPMPCLTPVLDSGVAEDGAGDVAPMPCLSPPLDAGGGGQDASEDAAPSACLRIAPIDSGNNG
jgi:hypothetical protein